jgi:hypothetical protein
MSKVELIAWTLDGQTSVLMVHHRKIDFRIG